MEIGRIKNLLIITLLIINAVLFALILMNAGNYSLSKDREQSIRALLAKNGLGFSTEMRIPSDFRPRPQMELYTASQNVMMLVNTFFDSLSENVDKRVELNKTVYSSQGKSLTVDVRGFAFESQNPKEKTGFVFGDEKSMRELCELYLTQLGGAGFNLTLDNFYGRDSYYVFEYRSVFDGKTVYSSYVRFRISENGVTQVRGMFYGLSGNGNKIRDIYPADEALLAMLYKYREQFGSAPAVIEKIDIVYRVNESSTDITASTEATPYYRVYLGTREEQPFLINAYTNAVE